MKLFELNSFMGVWRVYHVLCLQPTPEVEMNTKWFALCGEMSYYARYTLALMAQF